MSSIDEFFQQAAEGGGTPMAGFDFNGQSDRGIGLSVAGEILDIQVRTMTKKDDPNNAPVLDRNDKPVKQFVVDLQTKLTGYEHAKKELKDADGNVIPDDGKRRLWLRYQGARALVQAVQAAGCTSADLRGGVGAMLAVKRIENAGQMNQFEILFKKGDREPAVEDAFDAFGASSAPAATQQAAPAPQAQPAAAPASDSPWGSEPPF